MRLLACHLCLAAALQAQAPARFEVTETTIAQVHDAMKAGRLSCRELVSDYLDRIKAYDKTGPALNSIVVLNPDVEREAEELDRRFQASGLTGPLHCVPMIVKDNFETKGLQTSDGALAFSGYLPTQDAFQVRRIKEAGALVLAKSNMAEWAFSPYETVNSILPGYTRNPYALDRVTAGSSGGTAAAIAASLGLVGLGSDTGNSIRGPSSHQALVGIRSTMGLTSRAGIFPLSLSADIAGPMARTVEDALKVFQVIVGEDPTDPVTAAAKQHLPQTYATALNPEALKGAVIGVLRQAYERPTTDPEIVRVFNNAIEELKRAGATVVDPANIDGLDDIKRPRGNGPCMGFKYDLNRFLAARGDAVPLKNLTDIIKSNRFHPNNQARLENAEKGPENGPDSPACQADSAYREQVRVAVTKTMDRLKLDAFIYPTWSNPPRLIGDLNTPAGDNSQFYSPTTGFPAINVPMGFTRNDALPAGMTIYGQAWSEAKLLSLAYSYEQATHHRRPPASTPRLNAPVATKVIRFGKLWDGRRVLTNAIVIVDDDKIRSVTGEGIVPAGTSVIDLSRYTGMPGMIDMHTHVTYYWNGAPGTTPLRQPRRHIAVNVVLAQKNGMKSLEAGVTTLRDLNASGGADVDLRDLINMGAMVGPRLFVSTGGLHSLPKIPAMKDKIAEQIKQTKAVIAAGADWVKVFGSTGGFDNVTGEQTVSYEEMKAIVDTAHAEGHKVAIHSYGPAGARDAVKAGCDTLEHATDMDDAIIAELVRKKIYYVPTIDHNRYYVENADDVYHFPEGAKENLNGYIERNFATAKKAFEAGALMLVGSDAVYNGFGLNMRELTWFVKMGMTNEQALRTATVLAAQALGMESTLGSVAPAHFADITAVEGDPLSDIHVAIEKVRWVMKGGNIVVDNTKNKS